MIKTEYRVRGFQEVISPNVFNLKLWKTSGHYLNYKDNIFMFKADGQGFGMKPMNCPAHALMFNNELRSFRDLPIRFADFGVLHRNEISGALSGLTRVRRFCQDDAHQFCTEDQIMDEIMNNLDFLEHIYGIFGFTYELELSTRPEKRLGSEALWDKAEAALEEALIKFGKPWKFNHADGAFYGPKIDIKVFDALKRAHQCGTIQLDFQNPIRFNLHYKTDEQVKSQKSEAASKKTADDTLMTQMFKKDEWDDHDYEWKEQPLKAGHARPVMIHRAILGSVERFMAVLIEHLAGKWPFFISPRQAIICPISVKSQEYCDSVYLYLHQQGFQVHVDHSNMTLNKKIRTHQLEQFNFILVAGEEEAATGTVDIRTRENQRLGKMRVDKLADYLKSLLPKPSNAHNLFYEKAWDPAMFEQEGISTSKGQAKETTKLYTQDLNKT
jgi:glutathione S-transferase/translation elongation factor EF-1beta